MSNLSDSIDHYRKLAALFIAAAGVLRGCGIIFSYYVGVPNEGLIPILPTIFLLMLAIGVYHHIRGTWSLSLLLCSLLAYQLLSQIIAAPWSELSVNWKVVLGMFMAAADLTMYVLSIVFLFRMQYRKTEA